jgi:glutamine synthetase
MENGLMASFMPKPIFGINGSGSHTHQSISDKNGKNIFFDPNDDYNLSKLAKHFLAGQLKHAKGIAAVTNPIINSYKRLTPGYEAPVYLCWARRNRSALIRVPEYHPGKEKATRLEARWPDPSMNPFLGFAVMLEAGLDGIKKKIEAPDAVEEDVYHFDDAKLKKFYIDTLPATLAEAMKFFAESEIAKRALGEYIVEKLLEAQKIQWEAYRLQVHKWELDRYLAF